MPLTHDSDSLETRNLTVHDVLMLGEGTTIELRQMASPVAPPNGSLALFAKTGGKLYVKDSAGNEFEVTGAGVSALPVAIAEGGTGATVAADARTNLGLSVGTDVAAASHTHSAEDLTTGTLDGNRLAAKHKTLTKIVYIEAPKATDSFPIAFVADAATLLKVRGVTDAGTVGFNIEHRATDTPDVGGTGTLTSDITATETGVSSTDFSDATVPADRWLTYKASAVSGSATKLWVALVYTID